MSDHVPLPPSAGRRPECVQPGGGFCMRVELAWGYVRRAYLRLCRRGYVRHMAEKRRGQCPDCSHRIIDARDLKYYRNVCGYGFDRADDRFCWRDRLGLARYGLAEIVLLTLLIGTLIGALTWGAIALKAWDAVLLPWLAGLASLVLGLVWVEIIWFFRDPERKIPDDPRALVSPADGTVTNVEEVADGDFPGGRALRISIFLSIFNVHVNRVPRSGKVIDVRYFPGAFLDARNPASAARNEQLWIDLEDGGGRRLRVKQISGAIARRIVCWLKAGDDVAAGQRFGMIKLGSRTDVLLPAESGVEVLVKPGDKVKGGATTLLRLP